MNSHANPNQSYVVHAVVMLAFATALGVLAFSLVIHHRGVPERVHEIHASR